MGYWEYWRSVRRRALHESLQAVRWDNWERVLMAFCPLIAAALMAWYFLGDATGGIVRLCGTIGATAVLGVVFFGVRMLTVPAKMHEELSQIVTTTTAAATDPVPDWPINDLFHHIDPLVVDGAWEKVGLEVMDRLATGQLMAWGRLVDEEPTPLRPINRTYWEVAKWTYMFFTGDPDAPHTKTTWHVRDELEYKDVRVSKSQALRVFSRA